jgi:oxaloacetate decarboxylase alpha subunit/pyruvate carboxylase subunit B
MNPVIFNNTVLRDGHQSLAATRMTTAQMAPVAPLLDTLRFGALETWGGATIDSCLRFLGEDPFQRLDQLKAWAPRTPHMMLLRGQNLVGYVHYPDDVVEAFVRCAARHGMDIFRIFDALNDPRNMEASIRAVKKAGKIAHGTICYTTSPVHNVESFVALGVRLEAMGCDAIVIKDMAGLIPPIAAARIIRGLKEAVKIPIWIHTHDTAGLGATTYLAAIDAGVDAIDVSVIPFANGTAQPDCGRMLALLDGHPRRPAFSADDLATLQEIRRHLEKVYAALSQFTSHANEVVDSDTLLYQVPGGMLSNFRTQLKEQKMEDRFDEVLREIPRVRQALGWIPLVTPTSQIVGVQAMLNVKFGPWKNFSPQAADIALGYYGSTPAPVDPAIQKLAAEKMGKPPITCRPADLQKPGLDKLLADLQAKGLPATEENAVLYAMFPQQVEALHAPPAPAASNPAPASAVPISNLNPPHSNPNPPSSQRFALTINGIRQEVTVETLS